MLQNLSLDLVNLVSQAEERPLVEIGQLPPLLLKDGSQDSLKNEKVG